MLKLGITSTAVHAAALLLGVLTTVLFTRVMGAAGYGIYAFAYSVVMILTIPVQAGIPTLVMRETARLSVDRRLGQVLALWKWSGRIVLIGALCATVVGLFLSILWKEQYSMTLAISAALIPFIALSSIRSAALKGLQRVILGQLPDIIFRPLLLFLTVGIFYIAGSTVSAELVMGVHVACSALSFGFGAWALTREAGKIFPAGATDSKALADHDKASWNRAVLPLSGVSALQMVNANLGVIVIGIFSEASEVAVFKVAITVAGVLMFGRTAIISIVQPRMAAAFQAKEYSTVQELATTVSMVSFATALLIAMSILVFGEWALPLVFGADFAEAWPALLLVIGGQLINSYFASVGSCLMMAREEGSLFKNLVFVSALSIPLYSVLACGYGAMGAGLAMAVHNGLLHVMYWRAAKKNIRIDASPVPYVRQMVRHFMGRDD